jgi:hypothetical protein
VRNATPAGSPLRSIDFKPRPSDERRDARPALWEFTWDLLCEKLHGGTRTTAAPAVYAHLPQSELAATQR